MVKLSNTAKKMTMVVSVLIGVLILASIVYYRSFAFLPFAIGAILGGGLNIVKILLLNRIVEKTVSMDPSVTVRSFYAQYFLRFILTIGVLLAAALVPFISLWGAVAGVGIFPIAAYSMSLFKLED